MWNRQIDRQQIRMEGQTWCAADRPQLVRLAVTEPDEALRDVYAFLADWFDGSPEIGVQTSGSTGVPKQMRVSKERMMNSACQTCSFLGLETGCTALLCMNMKYIGAKMMVVRALVAGMNLLVRPAVGHPMTLVDGPVDFTAIVPLQLYQSLQTEAEKRQLSRCRHILVGGGAVDAALCEKLAGLPSRFYSTYGMTETLSHIALRLLNGPDAGLHYTPFDNVRVSLSADNTLVIDAPELCDTRLVTNDVARVYPDGTFVILGRRDNTVNSGGIKIQLEEDEALLKSHIGVPFALTAVPDERLGEALVLLVSRELPQSVEQLRSLLSAWLPRYHVPRYVLSVEQIPLAGNGKINRAACRELAVSLINT